MMMPLTPDDYVSPDHAGYAWSLVIGIGVLFVGVGAFITSLFVRAIRFSSAHVREESEMRELARQPLTSGPRRVVHGRVELDEGADVAIEIDIDQAVKNETSKNAHWHTWNETSRSTKTQPFYLVREDGESVYVEPPEDVLVVDTIETKYPTETPRMRVRFVDVRRDEVFFVYGDLDRGAHPRAKSAYRDGGSGWILRSPRERMLLATELIRDRYRTRVSYLYKVGFAWAAVFAGLHLLLTAPFLVAAFTGKHTTGTVTDRRTWVTVNKNNKTTHYGVTVRTMDHLVFEQEVPSTLYYSVGALASGVPPVTIPVLETNHDEDLSYFGDAPTLPIAWLMTGTFSAVVAFFLTQIGFRSRVPWYDRQKLDEYGGTGHWVEPRPENPVTRD